MDDLLIDDIVEDDIEEDIPEEDSSEEFIVDVPVDFDGDNDCLDLTEETPAQLIGCAVSEADIQFFRSSFDSLNSSLFILIALFILFIFVYLGHSLRTLFSRIGG